MEGNHYGNHVETLNLLKGVIAKKDQTLVPSRKCLDGWESILGELDLYRNAAISVVKSLQMQSSAYRQETSFRWLGFLVKYRSEVVSDDGAQLSDHVEPYQAVQLELGERFGSVWIKPEGMAERLLDLVARKDVDFQDSPEFSKRYHVVCSHEDEFRQWASSDFLSVLGSQPGLHMEIRNSTLTITSMKVANEKDALMLWRLGKELVQTVGTSSA